MADEVVFEVNAGQILAKLHLGCKQMLKKATFYNSGIIGNDEGLTPEKSGKLQFDLKNMNGQYEIAVALEEYYVYMTLTNVQIQKILDHAIKTNDKEDDKKFQKNKDELKTKLEAYLPTADFNGQQIGKAAVYGKWQKFAKAQLQQAFTYLKEYLENFCGKDNAKQLTEEQLVPFFIDDPFNYKYAKYTIPTSKNIANIKTFLDKFDKEFDNALEGITNIDKANEFVDKGSLQKIIEENKIVAKDLKVKRAYKIGFQVQMETV